MRYRRDVLAIRTVWVHNSLMSNTEQTTNAARIETIERTCGECLAGDACRNFHSPYGKCEGNPLAPRPKGNYLQNEYPASDYEPLFRPR